MKLKNKPSRVIIQAIPIILMIILIYFIKSDYILSGVYLLIILVSLLIHYEKKEYLILIFGFVIMILSEYFFISTRVESFNRTSLFGVMPIWLPILWAYVFVAIKRAIKIIQK